jgi:hypothetical protein
MPRRHVVAFERTFCASTIVLTFLLIRYAVK